MYKCTCDKLELGGVSNVSGNISGEFDSFGIGAIVSVQFGIESTYAVYEKLTPCASGKGTEAEVVIIGSIYDYATFGLGLSVGPIDLSKDIGMKKKLKDYGSYSNKIRISCCH